MNTCTFCPAPWISISTDITGESRPCCRYEHTTEYDSGYTYGMPNLKDGTIDEVYNSPKFQELRAAFLRGEKPAECNACWEEEEAGVYSLRRRFNKRVRMYDIDYDLQGHQIPRIFDFKLSNACNYRCRMCNPMTSSSIQKEMEEQGEIRIADDMIDREIETPEQIAYRTSTKILDLSHNQQIFFEKWLPHVREIELTGGEPFFSHENLELIQRIAETPYVSDITLCITTNGSVYNEHLVASLKKFKRVVLVISCDDMGERLEYSRDQSSWDNVISNYHKFNSHGFGEVKLHSTISNYNVWYQKEFLEYCNEHRIRLSHGFVWGPPHLCVHNINRKLKDIIIDKYKDHKKFQTLINFINIDGPDLTYRFLGHIKAYDMIRNQDHAKTYPEYHKILMGI